MPKVSEAHRAARRRQILDAARRCFVRNGFHATSMPDVFRESGLSAGAVYRYFPSKHAIVTAIAEEAVGPLIEAIDQITAADPVPPLEETVARALALIDVHTGPEGTARIAVQVWAEAMRDPALADFVAEKYQRIRSKLADTARRAQTAGQVPAHADPEQVAAVLFGVFPGYILQRLVLGDVSPDDYLKGLRALLGSKPG